MHISFKVAILLFRIGQLTEVTGRIKSDLEESGQFSPLSRAGGNYRDYEEREMQVTQPILKVDSLTYSPPSSSLVLCKSKRLFLIYFCILYIF